MADHLFFTYSGEKTLAQILELTDAKIHGDLPKSVSLESTFENTAPLKSAESAHISVLHNKKYAQALTETKAGVVLLDKDHADSAPKGCVVLVADSPYRAYAAVAAAFYPDHDSFDAGLDSEHNIHPTAVIGQNCTFEAGVKIGADAVIGEHTYIAANTVIGRGVKIGKGCKIASNVSVTHAYLGDGVVLHTGVRIGQAGFGFHMDRNGHVPVPQLGRVIIEDKVDIGANTTVDRGSMEDTVIGAGSRIDNLVMIAHNVKLGKGCVIVAQVGIAGSTTVGDFTVLGGQVGVSGHISIGSGVQVAAQSGIMRDIPDGMIMAGAPAVPFKQWTRTAAILNRLANKKGPISL